MYRISLDAAQDAFRRRATTATAWTYLVTAVGCCSSGTMSDRAFFCAVREIVDYLSGETKEGVDDDGSTSKLIEKMRPHVLH